MRSFDATEEAYKNGYADGYKNGLNAAIVNMYAKQSVFCAKCKKAANVFNFEGLKEKEGESK